MNFVGFQGKLCFMEMILISRIIRLIGLPFGKSLSLMSNYQDWFKWLITFSVLWIQHNTSFIVNQNLRWHNLQNVNRGKMLMNRYSKRNKLSLQAAQAAPKFDLWFNACNYFVKLFFLDIMSSAAFEQTLVLYTCHDVPML